MKTTLLIMAAGIGSRFGTGIKQLEPVDDANHIIIGCGVNAPSARNAFALFSCHSSGRMALVNVVVASARR